MALVKAAVARTSSLFPRCIFSG